MNIDVVDEISQLFLQYGHLTLGENCTQLQHAIQCATLAEHTDSTDELIVAAFLHDIGHLYAIKENLPGIDSEGYCKHELIGAALLEKWGFPSSVTIPIALHVQAKRFLKNTDSHYEAQLSRASRNTLVKQGEGMSNQEQIGFLQNPFARDALLLRKWDDAGKIPGRDMATFHHWLKVCAKVRNK
ncbi:HD domain-containing protein [Microbulbifer echini]|uniref:HD domain-containing protein n=1 Tax=Microbulbifer echini TaxID=1529067 RepID=A0ABV4NSW0_9GAMM|nr:HD domain-containing protein [uncultured Microbulbifer sp.]